MPLHNLLQILCFATLAKSLPTSTPQESQAKYGRLIVFGDSYSDNGTGAWEATNHTWPADPAYCNHSFSNGPVWPITLSKALGSELIDYATGGATADNSVVAGFTGPTNRILVPSAYDQVKKFLATDSPQANYLFVHYIGGNDPINNPSIQGSAIISLINRDVDLLYRSGARTVLLANYPPISSFPAAYGVPLYQQIGPPYTTALNKGLYEIQAPWSAHIDVRVVNVQQLFERIVQNPEAYGIDAKYVDPPTPCLLGEYGTPTRVLCTDPERHLFFDGLHPVAQVHDRIASLFLQTLAV